MMRTKRPTLYQRLALATASLVLVFQIPSLVRSDEPGTQPPSDTLSKKHEGTRQLALQRYFRDELWVKVASNSCINCHNAKGDAEDSDLILRDPSKARPEERDAILRHNLLAFEKISTRQEKGQSLLLSKVVGKLDHEGEQVLKPDSTRYRIVEGFVNRATGKGVEAFANDDTAGAYDPPPFFQGVAMLDDSRLLRRVTLSLGARLPSAEERAAVEKSGLEAIETILSQIMTEDAFYDRLAEGFNDIFLTPGIEDSPLSYNHFSKTRHWYQKYDLSHIKDEKERREAGYKLAREYREAMKREPMELIKYIVRNERPFTELVTADYILVSPYTSRGYGVYEEIKDKFQNSDTPYEYIPVRLKALQHRNGRDHQVTPTGYFPHAGIMSTFQYLRRYPTTDTNRNRLRSRMYYQHFLGVDILALAPRNVDTAAVSAKFDNPTMQASDCVVCHTTMDPVAGLFQDYQNKSNDYGPRKEGWYQDMFAPGREGIDLVEKDRWRVLPWLGEQTAKDPRFAVAMVEHVWYILTGRKVLLPPQDIEDPVFASRHRAYRMQRDEIERIAVYFAENGFDLKDVFRQLVVSPFYRADGLATVVKHPRRQAELNDLGLVRLLSPEQLERKLNAIFGKRWGRLREQTAILYGGLDYKQITQRIDAPSGAMGAIQRTMANDVSCKNVAVDFTTEPKQRRLFPHTELDVVPGASPQADKQIREAIVHLHQHLLGRTDKTDAAEVDRTYALFTAILSDAKSKKNLEKIDSYFCRGCGDKRVPDPHYTLRAWRGVVTYLLRQHEFLYE